MKKRPTPEPSTMTASIEEVKRSYYISEVADFRRVDDEAIIDVIGRIDEISPAHKRHLGKQIDLTLVCARSFHLDETQLNAERPSLFSVHLRGEQRSLMAYLPADTFWNLSSMMMSGEITHIEAQFLRPRYGHGQLLNLYWRGPIDTDMDA